MERRRHKICLGSRLFLAMPDTRGTILSDKDLWADDRYETESLDPEYVFDDKSDDTWYDDGERYTRWSTEDNSQFATPNDDADQEEVYGAIADGIDNDGDSDDFNDLNQNGIPDCVCK